MYLEFLKSIIEQLFFSNNGHHFNKISVTGFRRYNIRVFHIGIDDKNGGNGHLWTWYLFSGLMEQTGFFHSDGWVCILSNIETYNFCFKTFRYFIFFLVNKTA